MKKTTKPSRAIILEGEVPQPKAVDNLAKQQQMATQLEKLVADEKRWMRKLSLATTKLSKIRLAQRRLNKRREALN